MASARVASRYVKSLLGLAVDKNALDAVHADMQSFTRVCEQNMQFVLMLRSPIVRHEKKKSVMQKMFRDRVHPLTMAFIEILTKKYREPLLPMIASEFHTAYNDYKGIGKASVTTPIAMDASLRTEIERMVKTLSQKTTIELDEKVDAALIGGFVLNVGDRQIDASIKNKLKSLKVKLQENPHLREL
jgi:F-type H+-transporting ATPase subunit delta